jgi:DNA primase
MPSDLGSFILAQLRAVGIHVTNPDSYGENFSCYCFRGHDSKTPSLSVRKKDGAFFCFGCNVKGANWKVLKKYVNVNDIPEGMIPDVFDILNDDLKKRLRRNIDLVKLPWDVQAWRGSWRGVSSNLLREVGALYWPQEWRSDKEPKVIITHRILFPIWQFDNLLGFVSRRLDKSEHRRYYNTPGMSSKEVLYPLDHVSKMLGKAAHRSVVLVEGAYDALRLIDCGIPALAIMGTRNYDDSNRILLVNLGIEKVVLALDGGTAGLTARYEIAPSLREWFDFQHFFTPIGEDPGSMSDKHVESLRIML